MYDGAAFAERREQMLGLFAEKVLALACDIQQTGLAAEGLADKSQAAGAMHKLGRALRQSLLLHDRFVGQRLKGEAEAQRKARDEAAAPRRWKHDRIRSAVERVVWNEYERDEDDEDGPGERLLEDIEDRLQALCGQPDFMETSDEAMIAKLCEEFALDVPPHIIKALAIVAAADTPRPNGHDGPLPDSS